jgi:hypothetical protein
MNLQSDERTSSIDREAQAHAEHLARWHGEATHGS